MQIVVMLGISLSLDQWKKLKEVIPEIDSKIQDQS